MLQKRVARGNFETGQAAQIEKRHVSEHHALQEPGSQGSGGRSVNTCKLGVSSDNNKMRRRWRRGFKDCRPFAGARSGKRIGQARQIGSYLLRAVELSRPLGGHRADPAAFSSWLIRSTMAAANASSSSARIRSRPSTKSRPSAPIAVETTGLQQGRSMILMRVRHPV